MRAEHGSVRNEQIVKAMRVLSLSFIRVRHRLIEPQSSGSELSILIGVLSFCFFRGRDVSVCLLAKIWLLIGFTFHNTHSRRISLKCQITNELTP